MGGGHSQEEEAEENQGRVNVLGLSPQSVADVKTVMALVGPDAPVHCVQAHVNYFRQHPQHLESFCGRPPLQEPRHYSPLELNKDKQFADRAVMHGLALLQILRCSCYSDADALSHLAAGLVHAHRGLNLTRDVLKDYADNMTEYLIWRLQPAMTPATTLSWRRFLYAIAEAISSSSQASAFGQYEALHNMQLQPSEPTKPEEPLTKSIDIRRKLVEDIRQVMLVDPESIRKTAAQLIQKCERKILASSAPISTTQGKDSCIHLPLSSDEPPCSKLGLCSRCIRNSLNKQM